MKNPLKKVPLSYRETLLIFRKNFSTNFAFEILYKSTASLLIIPLIVFIFQALMKLKGFTNISNKQISTFILSPVGIISAIVIALIATFYCLFEFQALIIIAQESYYDKKISMKNLFISTLSHSKKLFKIVNIPIIIFVLIVIPLTNSAITSSFIKGFDIPDYISGPILESSKLTLILLSVLLFVNIFAFLGIFLLHCMLLEKKTFFKAYWRSFKLVKMNLFSIFFRIIFWNMFLGILYYPIKKLTYFALIGLASYFKNNPSALNDIVNTSALLSGILYFVFSLISVPLNMMLVTSIYYQQVIKKDGKNFEPISVSSRKGISFEKHFFKLKYAFIVIFLLLSVFAVKADLFTPDTYKTKITAHRGSSVKAPENTKSSIEYAINDHLDYAEIDAQETKDGVIVLTHDSNFKRTSGQDLNIWETNFKDIEALDVGSFLDPKFKGEKVPTLDEIIKMSKGKIKLNIEIKLSGHEKNLTEGIIKVIKDNNFEDQCVVASLDYNEIQKAKLLDPKIKIGYIMFASLGNILSLNVDLYSIESTNVTQNLVDEIHGANKLIHVWTINTSSTMRTMYELGVDGIITDDTDTAIEVLKDLNNTDAITRIKDQWSK